MEKFPRISTGGLKNLKSFVKGIATLNPALIEII